MSSPLDLERDEDNSQRDDIKTSLHTCARLEQKDSFAYGAARVVRVPSALRLLRGGW